MAGLAAGNWVLGRRADRMSAAEALRLYALLEAAVAGWAALSPFVFPALSSAYPAISGALSSFPARAALCAVLLLPATFAMGGTLPAVARAAAAADSGRLGVLYAANTVGAAAGPLIAAFVLLPRVGLAWTVEAAAALNAAVAAAAFALSRRPLPAAPAPAPEEPCGPAPRLVLFLAAASGFVSMALEIALTRRLVLTVTGSSVYALATILSVFLGGLALGSALLRAFPPRGRESALLRFGAAMAVVFGWTLVMPWGDLVPLLLAPEWARLGDFGSRMALNALTVTVLVLPVTAFGYSLPLLAAALPGAGPAAVGRLFAANTVGAALGAPVAGFWLIREAGLDTAIPVLGAAALAAGMLSAAAASPRRWWPALATALAGGIALVPILPTPDADVMNAGLYNRAGTLVVRGVGPGAIREAVHGLGAVVWQADGMTGRIAIRKLLPAGLSFLVNGKPDGASVGEDLWTEIGSVELAALAHPRPRKVLLVGLGTGISAGALLAHPGIEEVHVVEIEPLILEVARRFSDWNRDVMRNPRLRLHLDDARHYLLADRSTYDLVIVQPSNLWISGMVNLYTVEALTLARRRLAPGGIMLQWLHYYQIGESDLAGALATFQAVFPQTTFWMHEAGDSFMVGSAAPLSIDLADWQARGAAPGVRADLVRSGISGPLALVAFFRLGPAEVAANVGGAAVCRDDFPFLEFTSPHVGWNPLTTARRRLFLRELPVSIPVPLARETAESRVRLGDEFLSCDLARARLEYSRALELSPRSQSARRGLEKVKRYLAQPSPPSPGR